MLGVVSDSHGDLEAFDAAFELLRSKGARRILFAGARYTDLDEWVVWRRARQRGGRAYSDGDFLHDVTRWLDSSGPTEVPPSFGADLSTPAPALPEEDPVQLKALFMRTPERECLQYRDPAVSKKLMDMVGDSLCCLVHDKNDLTRDDLMNASVFIHGKAPEAKVVQIGPRFFITPGRLAGAAEQTCAYLERVDRNLRFSPYRLDGTLVSEPQLLVLDRRTKLSVK